MIYELFKEWDAARSFILPALEFHKTHSEDDILLLLIRGDYKLWRTDKCAVVTCFVQFPRFKALETRWAGGDLEALKNMQDEMERWAIKEGCKQVVATGRLGWERVFKDYSRCGAIYFKEL